MTGRVTRVLPVAREARVWWWQVYVAHTGTSDIRPARVHYLLALWGLKEPTRQWTPVQSLTTPVTHWLRAHASVSITRILSHNQTLLAGKRGDSSTRCKSKDSE